MPKIGEIPEDAKVYMLVLGDYSHIGREFKPFNIIDVTRYVVYDELTNAYHGQYPGSGTSVEGSLSLDGYDVELFYSVEGAIAFAAAFRLERSVIHPRDNYERDASQPPKP